MSYRSVTSAFEAQLRSLCLRHFPCGQGSWRKARGGYGEEDDGREGPGAEEPEDLIELLTSPLSPWRQEEEEEGAWSPQAAALRKLSVRAPAHLSTAFIYEYFTTLRLVNKGVSIIDAGVLRFSKLEELVLTANHISDVLSAHLPATLRVLELYGNQVSSLQSLCQTPPPCLQHLGLGLNCLGSCTDTRLLTASFWPGLVSLDLSWSGFTQLLALLDSLATLPRLRTLWLEGNPLALTPAYPGLALDSLPRLLHLDGRRVTPDQRHRARGMAKLRDAVLDEAVVTVTVHRMRGVPDRSLDAESSTAEFPVVSYGYLVTYEFLPSESGGDPVTPIDLTEPVSTENSGGPSHLASGGAGCCERHLEEGGHTAPPAATAATEHTGSEVLACPVMVHSTPQLPWAEVLEFDHAGVHHVTDLTALKAFLLRGLRVTVQEHKVLSWPASLGESTGSKPGMEKKGGSKESAHPPSGSSSNQKAREKRRKKESQTHLVQDTPIRKTLGCTCVELRDLVSGGDQVHWLCDLGVQEQSGRVTAPQDKETSKKSKDDKKKEDKKAKPVGESTAPQRNSPSSKSRNRGRKESEMERRAESAQRGPLTVELSIRLHKWQTAA